MLLGSAPPEGKGNGAEATELQGTPASPVQSSEPRQPRSNEDRGRGRYHPTQKGRTPMLPQRLLAQLNPSDHAQLQRRLDLGHSVYT